MGDIKDDSKSSSDVAAPEPLKVLLVEDSGPLTERVTALIEDLREVQLIGAVATERAATEALSRATVDALVLDLHLQQGDGFGVLRFIRRQQLRVAAIVFTSYDIPQYRRAAATLGAAEFFHKARDYDKLGGALRRLAATHPRHKPQRA